MDLNKTQNAAEAYVVTLSNTQRLPLARLVAGWRDLEVAFLAGAKWREAQVASMAESEKAS